MQSNSPAYYRARVQAIGEALAYELSLPKSREQEMRIAYLRNGHVPDRFLSGNQTQYKYQDHTLFNEWVDLAQKEVEKDKKNGPLTELELHTYDTYFQLYPEKVCGKQQGGSGYSFPVRTIGSRADIERAIDATLQKSTDSPSKVPQKSVEKSLVLAKAKAKALKIKMKLLEA